MSDIDNDPTLEVPDELTALKARADLMGVSYHPNIKVDKLREKVNAAVFGEEAKPAAVEPKADVAETDGQRRQRKKKEANELVRVRVACMNPSKKEWEGEIFTVGNATIGSFTKFVPFNNEDGWHIPRVILEQMQARQCQVFVTKKDARGNPTRKGQLIKEFAIDVLSPLTKEELHDLAQRQAMAKTVD